MARSDHGRWVSRPRQAEMGTAFLEGGCQTPALHEIAHELLSGVCLVGGKPRFGRSCSRWIAGEDPPNGHGSRPKTIPAGGPATQLPCPRTFAIPVQDETLPNGVRGREEVVQGGRARTHDTWTPSWTPSWTPHGVGRAHGSRLVDDRVQAKGSNQRDLLFGAVHSPVQDAGGPVSHELDRPSRQPATQQTDHLAGPPTERFVADPQMRADLGGGASTHRKGNAHCCRVQGALTTTARTIQRKPGLLTER
jgi:hypothetical protein